MNKNFAIRPAVTKLNGQLIETYERKTNATPEQLEALGLDPTEENYSRLGIQAVREYIQLIGLDIPAGKRMRWNIADIGQELEIDNVYVQAPTQDSFDLEVHNADDIKLLDYTVSRERKLLEMPDSLLTTDLTLTVFAHKHIGLIAINCRPAVLLGKFYGKLSDSLR